MIDGEVHQQQTRCVRDRNYWWVSCRLVFRLWVCRFHDHADMIRAITFLPLQSAVCSKSVYLLVRKHKASLTQQRLSLYNPVQSVPSGKQRNSSSL